MSIRSRLRESLHGTSGFPAFVLSTYNGIDEFDMAATAILAPEIVAEFHSDAATYGYLIIPQVLVGFLLPILIGYAADRRSRVKMTVVGGTLWVASAILSAVSPTIAAFALFRLFSVVAKGFSPVHLSLLADYYPTKVRGFAYASYNAANRVGHALGLLVVGFLGQWFGWRWALIAVAVPGAVFTLLALRLKEPVRGQIEADEAGADEVAVASPIGPIRAARLLLKTPSFKRLCWATAWVFAAIAGSGVALSFYFSSVFNVSPSMRGVFQFLTVPASVGTLYLGGAVGQRLLARGRADLVAKLSAVVNVLGGVCFALLAFAPNVASAVLVMVLLQAVLALPGVALQLLVAQIVPPHVRSQAFGLFGFFLYVLTPVALIFGLPLGDRVGFRYAVLVFSPCLLVAAYFTFRAGQSIRGDIARTQGVALAAAEARQRKAAGEKGAVLVARGIDAGYGTVQILFNVDMYVADGEIVALLGTNGAGKSTMLKAISGLLTPTSGGIFLDGEDVTGLDAEVTASRGIIQVPGGRGVFPGLSVRRNLDLGTYMYWDDKDYCEAARADVIELFPRLGERLDQLAGTLSGGEQQMLTLAQAFMSKPRIMMIDELSLGLAPVVVQELLVAVREMNARGTSLILVEQSVNIAMTLAHRAYFMEKGEVRFEGATSELMGRDDLLRSIFLEGATSKMVKT